MPNPEYWWSIGYCYAKIGALLNVKCGYWWSIDYCYAKIGAPLNVKCGDWLSIGYCYAKIGAPLNVKCGDWLSKTVEVTSYVTACCKSGAVLENSARMSRLG